ncbi:hypothetical protein CR513_15339, partial [Mucuna pruriens]
MTSEPPFFGPRPSLSNLILVQGFSDVPRQKHQWRLLRTSALTMRGQSSTSLVDFAAITRVIEAMATTMAQLNVAAKATVEATGVVGLPGFHGLVEFRRSDPP